MNRRDTEVTDTRHQGALGFIDRNAMRGSAALPLAAHRAAGRGHFGRRGGRPSRAGETTQGREGPCPHGLYKNASPGDCYPPARLPNRRHPAAFACPRGTTSPRSTRKGRPQAPLRNLQRRPVAGCPCELRQVGEGPRPRRPQEYRAQRTAPLPRGPMGGTASSRSARKGRHRGPRQTFNAT